MSRAAAGPENDSSEKPIISILIAAEAEAAAAASIATAPVEYVASQANYGNRRTHCSRGHQSVMDDARHG